MIKSFKQNLLVNKVTPSRFKRLNQSLGGGFKTGMSYIFLSNFLSDFSKELLESDADVDIQKCAYHDIQKVNDIIDQRNTNKALILMINLPHDVGRKEELDLLTPEINTHYIIAIHKMSLFLIKNSTIGWKYL